MKSHSAEFVSATRAAEKAWYGTPMLARVRQARGEQLQELVSTGTPRQWAEYLLDVAGPSFASYAMTSGMDAKKAEKLGALVVEMAWGELPLPGPTDPEGALKRLELFSAVLQGWIDTGGAQPGGDLARAGALLGRPEPRLALVAPFASALGVCTVMVRAMASGYPMEAGA